MATAKGKDGGAPLQPIVIKRIKKVAAGHHGGAWKIAYADFVTAMMAFFLLMWLLGSTSKGDLKGIADYFNSPLKVAMAGGSGSGDSSSIIQGGGQDLTRQAGQVKNGDNAPERRNINLQAAKAEFARQEKVRLEELKLKIEAAIDANGALSQFRNQIRLDLTPEGLRIQIVDELNRPMFDSGSAMLKDYTREILREIGRALGGVDNRLTLSGHTDATPYPGSERTGYGNWELSADRANAARRELVASSLADKKILRVVGLASSLPFNPADPYDSANRRISIIVMNKQAEEAVTGAGTEMEIDPAGVAKARQSAIAGVPAGAVNPGVPALIQSPVEPLPAPISRVTITPASPR